MRFGYVLLGLMTLTSIHTSSGQQCSNGLAGVQNGEICCEAGCGTCGGGGCGSLPGGSSNCCSSRIKDSGMMCSDTQAAPCIVENESVCDNGLPGIQFGDICCDATCGTCGGSGCSRLPGGSSSCCTSRIRDSGMMCDTTMAAPCIVDEVIPPAMCDNGLPGVQRGDICCDASCETCGGGGCASRPGGPDSCCTSRIRESAMMCDTTQAAPCIVNGPTAAPTSAPTAAPTATPTTAAPTATPTTAAPTSAPTAAPTATPSTAAPTSAPTAAPTATPTTAAPTATPTATPTSTPTATPKEAPVPVCSNGFPGLESSGVCCETACGGCGGPGCGGLPGGSASCCTNVINTTGTVCSIALAAPCIIDN